MFSKDLEGTPPDLVFKGYVNTSGNIGVTLSVPTNLSSTEEKTSSSMSALTENTWVFVAYGLQLTSTAT